MEKKTSVAVAWLRNELRAHDNQVLVDACNSGLPVIVFYALDPIYQGKTSFGFEKMGPFRRQFLSESIEALQLRFQHENKTVLFKLDKAEDVLDQIQAKFQVKKVFYSYESCRDEIEQENRVNHWCEKNGTEVNACWQRTLFHIDDIPFEIKDIPQIFTQFRKKIEKTAEVRELLPEPDWRAITDSSIDDDLYEFKASFSTIEIDERAVWDFKGGEMEALHRMDHYFWESNSLKDYKNTRNGLIGADYSSKFSPWLANGSISPRKIYWDVQEYEKERHKNVSTYWIIFELLWRDYFRFIAMKHGDSLFHSGGLKQENKSWKWDKKVFEWWANGKCKEPFVDANMIELNSTGFMSNRGRQNVASYLVHDLKLDWRAGAEYFESLLIDYDPASNYGNWNYVAGIGNDPREGRKFNIPFQAKRYDPKGDYVNLWLGN